MPFFWHNRVGLQPVETEPPDFVAASLEPLLNLI
jgi:nitrate reductase assembly molybdenum cofactor insertion protein NarJ